MRLRIATAAVGTPRPGDELLISFEDGTVLILKFKPHTSFGEYLWVVQGEHPNAQKALKELEGRGIELEWVACYADDDYEIVVGTKLRMVLVPRGNMSDWPRFTSNARIAKIDIR